MHQRARRVLGLWAIGKGELYRQFHFFEGERTRMGMVGGWVLDVVLDVEDMVQEKMDRVAERAVVGVEAVKRWMLAEDEGVE